MKKRKLFLGILCFALFCLCSCGNENQENVWDVEEYEKKEDIVSVEKLDLEQTMVDGVEVSNYKVKYQSDDCIVVSYLSVPDVCIEEQKAYPCIIYNRGGNREFGANTPENIAYMAAREDSRIKKAVVISGVSDAFMSYDERTDMQQIFKELVGETPDSNPDVYEKRSATYWAEEIKCPILIIHSKLDERVSFTQAEKMVEELEKVGKEYKFVSYEDDMHGLHPEDFSIIMEWCQ